MPPKRLPREDDSVICNWEEADPGAYISQLARENLSIDVEELAEVAGVGGGLSLLAQAPDCQIWILKSW